MKLTIDIDNKEYRTLCSALFDYANKTLNYAHLYARKGIKSIDGIEYTIEDYKKVKAVSDRAFNLKFKVSESYGRFKWVGYEVATFNNSTQQ